VSGTDSRQNFSIKPLFIGSSLLVSFYLLSFFIARDLSLFSAKMCLRVKVFLIPALAPKVLAKLVPANDLLLLALAFHCDFARCFLAEI